MFENFHSVLFRKCGKRIFALRLGYGIYKWMVLSVQTRVNNVSINLRDINHVYFNTLKVGLTFSDIIHSNRNVYLIKRRNNQRVHCFL